MIDCCGVISEMSKGMNRFQVRAEYRIGDYLFGCIKNNMTERLGKGSLTLVEIQVIAIRLGVVFA